MATVTVIPPEPAAPLMAGLGAVAGVVGLNSQIVSGAYYAYHGNWDPLGKSAVGWGISKLNPLGKDTQPVWDRTVNLDSSKNDVKKQCSPE